MRFVGARSRWTLMMLPDQALMLMKTKRLADGERRDSVKDEMGGGKKKKGANVQICQICVRHILR